MMILKQGEATVLWGAGMLRPAKLLCENVASRVTPRDASLLAQMSIGFM